MNMSTGNMDKWVDCTINDLAGRCPNCCSFCYVNKMTQPAVREKYSGRPRLHAKSMDQKLGRDKVIFVSDCTDLFAEAVPIDFRVTLMARYRNSPENWYHFRSKTDDYSELCGEGILPPKTIIGTSIETTMNTAMGATGISHAPHPVLRKAAMASAGHFPRGALKMVALEPLFPFDIGTMVQWMQSVNPAFFTVGIDSKKTPHPIGEPTAEEIVALVHELHKIGDVILKDNLVRILGFNGFVELSEEVTYENSTAFAKSATYRQDVPILSNIDGYKYLDGLQKCQIHG